MVTVPPLTQKTTEIADKLLNDDTDPLYRRFALSRAITLLESTNEENAMEAEGLLAHLLKERAAASAKSLRIGIAGAPVSIIIISCVVEYQSGEANRRAYHVWWYFSLAVITVCIRRALLLGSRKVYDD